MRCVSSLPPSPPAHTVYGNTTSVPPPLSPPAHTVYGNTMSYARAVLFPGRADMSAPRTHRVWEHHVVRARSLVPWWGRHVRRGGQQGRLAVAADVGKHHLVGSPAAQEERRG